MTFSSINIISDICLIVKSVSASIEFYEGLLDFKIRRRAEGFVDFYANGIILAAWERDHISAHTDVILKNIPRGSYGQIIAVQLKTPEDVDKQVSSLSSKGVPFFGNTKNYPWNARCAYFSDPDSTVWELYAWLDGGPSTDFQ